MSLIESLTKVRRMADRAAENISAVGYQKTAEKHQSEIEMFCGDCHLYRGLCTLMTTEKWLEAVSERKCKFSSYRPKPKPKDYRSYLSVWGEKGDRYPHD